MLFMLALASQMGRGEWAVILITIAVALVNWLWVRRSTGAVGNPRIPAE
jgi:hypothetical protein